MQRMSRTGGIVAERRRRRAVVLGVPAAIVAVLAAVALWRVGTIGLNPERTATLDRVEVRQITSPRTFWAGALDDDPVFVVAERPIHLEPGSRVTVEGRVEAAPAVEAARREWGLDEATARAVRERGVYVRATRIRAQSPP
jgi:hypothetical protein